MATIQDLIEQWKKEAAQSQTVTSKDIPNIAMYQPQNEARREYNGNSALEREQNNKEFLQELEAQNQANNRQMRGAEINANRDALNMLMDMDVRSQGDLGVFRNAVKTQQAINNIQDQTARINELSDMLVEATKNAGMAWTLPGKMWNKTNPYLGLSDEDKAIIRNYIAANKGNQNMSEAEKATFKAFQTAAQRAGENLDIKSEELVNSMPAAQQKAFAVSEGFNDFFTPLAKAIGKAASPLIPGINAQSIDDAYTTNQRYMNSIKEQNPEYSNAGRNLGQMYGYAVTSPFVGGLAAKAGLGKGGEFALNQGVQLAQDLGLDIIPEAQRMLREEGKIDWAEIAKRTGQDIALNALMNKAPDILQSLDKTEYENLIKALGDSAGNAKLLDNTGALKQGAENVADAFKVGRNTAEGANLTPNELFRQNINEGAEKLAKLNEQGYIPPQKYSAQEIASLNVNPVEANNKQFGELMDEFNHQFKDDSAMRNIFTPEDLEAAQNSQFTELMKGRPKTIADLAPDEIPEINTELPEIPSLKNVDDYSNMWKSTDEIPEIAQNVPKQSIKERFGYIDLPEDVAEKGASDFAEIYDSLESMRKVAEASGDEKVLAKYEKLSKAVNDYENAFFKNESDDALISAKKATDAARQGFIREVKKTNPNYTGELTGNKLGNAAYRRTSMKASEEAAQELADSIAAADKELNTNRWVKDATPETQNPFRGVEDNKVIAEDIGLNPKTDLDYTLKEISESEAPKAGDSLKETTEVKERGQSKHIRNADTPMKMEDVSDEVVADFEKDPDMYAVLKNKDTKAKAENVYNTSANPEADFREMLSRKDPAALPLGHQIAKDYSAKGDYSAAAQIYRDMGEALTESGQFSQAAVINMVKNDPMTALEYAQKELNKLNDIGRQRFKSKWTDFELTPDEINAFKKIQPGDADGIKDVYDLIGTRLGKEYPTTFWEKVIEARRVAMLFNPRTDVRNVLANPPTLAMRWASDRVEAVGQNIAHLIDPNIKVTQSIYGSGTKGRKIAKEIYNGDQVQALLKSSGSKSELPELKNAVMTKKQVFKGTPVSKFIDKMTGGGIQKANEKLFGAKGVQSIGETIRNATYKALDLGDKPFVKENFVERLGSYIAAQGYKSASEVPEEAIMTAWEEAMKATYKDNSWAVGMLRNVKKGFEKADNAIPGLGTAVSQSAIPFVQAPGNIAARMVDYSPVGAIKGLASIVSGAKNGSAKSVEKGIEEVAKGLTGTGLIVLGMKLKESGVLTGTYSDNKRQKAFQKQNGFKEFAIHAGDGYFTYGWAQPFAQELMVGTLLQDAIEKSDEYDSDILKYFGIEGSNAGKAIGVAKEGTRAAVNSWFNESPISGLADFFKGNSYSDTDIAGNIWENGVEDFAGALVPAAVNATAKSLDPVQRNTYDNTNKFASFVNSNVAKLPVLSENLPAKYDTWGNEMRYAKTKAGAAATKFLVPGDYGYDKNDATDNEINRLFEATGNNNVFPPEAEKTVGDKKLDNWGVSTFQEDMGKRNRQLAESFIKSDLYKNLPDEEKAEILSNLYGASKTITKRDKFDSAVPDSSSYKKAIAAYDEAGGGQKGVDAMINFYAGKKIVADSGISDSSNASKEIQAAATSGDMEKAQKLADNAAKTKEILDKYDISTSSTAGKDIKAAIDAGKPREAEMIAKKAKAEKEEKAKAEETKDTLSSYGLDKTGPTKTYEKAKSEIPGLTTQQFATTYKKIDSDGNQGIKQDEIIDYLNNNNVSEAEAQKIWSAYGNSSWKKIPVLKNGKWTKGNK